MPNIQSAKKRVKVTAKKTLRNRMVKSSVRTSIKKLNAAIASDPKNAAVQLSETTSALDKAVAKGIIHKNAANRKRLVLPRSWPRLRCKPIRCAKASSCHGKGIFSHFGQSTQGGMAYAAIYGGAPCGGHCFQPGKKPGPFTWIRWGSRCCGKIPSRAGGLQAGSPAGRHGAGNFIKPDAPKRPSYPEALGLRHLAFRVADAEAAVRALEERGIACEPLRMDEITGKRMTFFQDPDGLPLEIHE